MNEFEARHLVGEWLRKEENEWQSTPITPKHSSISSTGSRVKYIYQRADKLNKNLIHFHFDKNPHNGRDDRSGYWLAWYGQAETHLIDGKPKVIYPVVGQAIDIKSDWSTPIVLMCFLSQHALARLLIRSNAESLTDINTALSQYIMCFQGALTGKELGNTGLDEFIILTANGYMPFCRIQLDEFHAPLCKTWVARDAWHRSNKDRLLKAANLLGDKSNNAGAAIFSSDSLGLAGRKIEEMYEHGS